MYAVWPIRKELVQHVFLFSETFTHDFFLKSYNNSLSDHFDFYLNVR